MDAITMLKNDHKTVERLFKQFEQAGPRALVKKGTVVDRVIEELSVHAAIEEQVFYPAIRATVPGVEEDTLEALEEHHIVKWLLSELDAMDPQDERFTAKMTVLMENVRHHVKEEEEDLFVKVRDELGRTALSELGEAMERARELAPTRPHPRAPDAPPANFVAGTAAGVIDRVRDTVRGILQGGVSAGSDLLAAARGRERPRTSPQGSRRTRRTAERVREDATEAAEAALDATRKVMASASSAGSSERDA